LNIGLDAIVFADDSRFECDFVRENLPEVEVLNLGEEPSAYLRLLSSSGYFDSLTFSREDSLRTQMYRAEAQRQELQNSTTSLPEYLASLRMVATLGDNTPLHRERNPTFCKRSIDGCVLYEIARQGLRFRPGGCGDPEV
jgi:predicted enzyme involved in methoxymalonyl-ACP biosynthesis